MTWLGVAIGIAVLFGVLVFEESLWARREREFRRRGRARLTDR